MHTMVRQSPEHTTGTGFAPGRATSEAPVAVGLCVLTSGASRQAERRHSARTAVGPAGIQRYPQGPSYTDRTEWWLVFGSVSAGRAEGETVARCGSGAVLQNTLWRCWWLGSSWWRRRRCRHQGPGLVIGDTKASPTRTGPVWIWCWRRDDAHHRTSVLAAFSCSQFAFIHAETSSMQTDTCCIRLLASDGWQWL